MSTFVKNINQSRREFLRTASSLSIAGTAAPFALNLATIGVAAAQDGMSQAPLATKQPTKTTDHGVTLTDGPLKGVLARAVVVIGPDGVVKHTELVGEIAHEPDYDAALAAL